MLEQELEELEEQKVIADTYKCPQCGAPMKYDPETGTLICDYCEHKIEIEGVHSDKEEDFLKADVDDNSWKDETRVFKCQQCGAVNIAPANEMSITCPFCGSNQVMVSDDLPGKKPNRVVPFKISQVESKTEYANWIKKKLFVPSKVKKFVPELDNKGVYVPAWTYDSKSFTQYEGRLGVHYTTTVGSGKNRRTVTKTRYFSICGIKEVDFDDVLVNAGEKIDQKEIINISPFGTNDSVEYDEKFLAGFTSEHYSVDVQKGWDTARNEMKSIIESVILKDYHYDVVDYLKISTNHQNVTYKYVLLPVWIGSFKYKNKSYGFLVNGETGKLNGKYPLSPLKVSIAVFIVVIFLGIIAYFCYGL